VPLQWPFDLVFYYLESIVPEDILFRLATGALIVINFGDSRLANGVQDTQTSRDHNLRTPDAIGTRPCGAWYHRPNQHRAGRSAER
jgi:hypothetical protein